MVRYSVPLLYSLKANVFLNCSVTRLICIINFLPIIMTMNVQDLFEELETEMRSIPPVVGVGQA